MVLPIDNYGKNHRMGPLRPFFALGQNKEDFRKAAEYVLEKNQHLYQRLA